MIKRLKPQQFKMSEDVIGGFEWLLFMTYLHLFNFFSSLPSTNNNSQRSQLLSDTVVMINTHFKTYAPPSLLRATSEQYENISSRIEFIKELLFLIFFKNTWARHSTHVEHVIMYRLVWWTSTNDKVSYFDYRTMSLDMRMCVFEFVLVCDVMDAWKKGKRGTLLQSVQHKNHITSVHT